MAVVTQPPPAGASLPPFGQQASQKSIERYWLPVGAGGWFVRSGSSCTASRGCPGMGAGGSSADAARDKEPCHLLADQGLAAKQHVAALVDRQQLRPGDSFGGMDRVLEG
jgi:hypothetical protein